MSSNFVHLHTHSDFSLLDGAMKPAELVAEAIRLKDLEELDQEECAGKMRISRPTFHRVLGSARGKLADALLNGKAIIIEGGNFEMATRRFRCADGHEWELPFEMMIDGHPRSCPSCSNPDVLPLQSYNPTSTGGVKVRVPQK